MDAQDMGLRGARLSCPGSNVVADEDNKPAAIKTQSKF